MISMTAISADNKHCDDFAKEGQTIQLGYPPHRIGILTVADGVNFSDCYAARIEMQVDDLQINVINLDHLR